MREEGVGASSATRPPARGQTPVARCARSARATEQDRPMSMPTCGYCGKVLDVLESECSLHILSNLLFFARWATPFQRICATCYPDAINGTHLWCSPDYASWRPTPRPLLLRRIGIAYPTLEEWLNTQRQQP